MFVTWIVFKRQKCFRRGGEAMTGVGLRTSDSREKSRPELGLDATGDLSMLCSRSWGSTPSNTSV